MRTGREPIGTSLTSFLSNISDNLAISVTSGGAISACRFVRPAAQPGKPALGFRFKSNDNDADVVHAAALVGERHQLFRGALRLRLRLQGAGNFGFGDHSSESIRTEE